MEWGAAGGAEVDVNTGHRQQWKGGERSGIEILEDAVLLLRSCGWGAWLVWLCGSVPFVLGWLYFWTDMGRGAGADERLAGGALAVTLLWAWMKGAQSVFCARLRDRLAGEASPSGWFGPSVRAVVVQVCLQPWGFLLIPVALVLTLPFGWVWAFFQNVSVLGAGVGNHPVRLAVLAARHASLWSKQNHWVIAGQMIGAVLAAVNGAMLILGLPRLAKVLFDVDTGFTLSPAAALNTTFAAATLASAWLVVDPWIKAAYVVRCFQGESRSTGADLRARLRLLPARRAAGMGTVAGLLFLLAVAGPGVGAVGAAPAAVAGGGPAVGGSESRQAPSKGEWDEALEEVLSRRTYLWRTERVLGREPAADGRPKGWVEAGVDGILRATRTVLRWMGRQVQRLVELVLGRWTPGAVAATPSSDLDLALILRVLLSVAVVAGGAFLGWYGIRVWRRRRRAAGGRVVPVTSATVPDLRVADVSPEALPVEGWLALAAQHEAAGEDRLAMRALHLAGISLLAARSLVTLARHKTNGDYRRELGRKAGHLPQVRQAFEWNAVAFDRSWYGPHPATRELCGTFRTNLGSLKAA